MMIGCVDIGGGGCGAAPCLYGCTPSAVGFTCACPAGFRSLGQGYVVTSFSVLLLVQCLGEP